MRAFLTIGPPLVFALVGATSRFTFQMVETRYQILTFWLLAAGFELCRSAPEPKRGIWRVTVNAATATAAIIAVKWHIEGVSPLIMRLVA